MQGELGNLIPLRDYLSRIDAGWSPACEQVPPGAADWGVIRVSAVTSGVFREEESKRLPENLIPRPSLEIKPGDLIMARANGARNLVGTVCVVRQTRSRLMLSDKTLRLIPAGNAATAEFLEIALRSSLVRNQVDALLSGSTGQGNIAQKSVQSLWVPRLSLSEQQRVVDVVHAVDERIAAESKMLLKEFLLCEGFIDEQLQCHVQMFDHQRMVDVCRSPGGYGSNSAAVARDGRLPRYVRITDIDDRGCLSSDLSSAVSIPWESGRSYLLDEGDLLIARTGFTTGKSYLHQESDGLCSFAGYLVRFRVDPAVMLPEYAFMWTRASAFKRWVSRNVHEVGQRNISAREYDEHRLPVPPLEVQRELVRAWEVARSAALLREQEIARLKLLQQAIADDLLFARMRVHDVA